MAAHPSAPGPRERVARTLAQAARRFPDLGPIALVADGLGPEDVRLATALLRTSLQRWLTLDHLLDLHLRQPLRTLEPAMQAVLLSGAAQLLFFERLPAYAVVSESVALARRLVRPKAAGMVNAVLRRTAELVLTREPDRPWEPAPGCLPGGGGTLCLPPEALPDPADFPHFLAVATSHPDRLTRRWIDAYGDARAAEIARHGVLDPPLVVALESPLPDLAGRVEADDWQPHEQEGFVLWRGDHEGLKRFLAEHPARRVQDPASAAAVASTAGLTPSSIVDYCAGRGTKTLQAAALHPRAQVLATDVDRPRLELLGEAAARLPHIEAADPGQVRALCRQHPADLVILDVPCSNTGVLARRPEARYRFTAARLRELVALQRQIIRQGLELLRPQGHLLYSTCSLEPEENGQQVAWMREELGLTLEHERSVLPAGEGPTYHDGSYHALLRHRG